MKCVHRLTAFIATLASVSCGGSEFSQEPEYMDQFSINLADESLTAPMALLNISFYRDGGAAADLSFEAVAEVSRTSLVLQPSFDELRERAFDAELVNGPAAEGRGNWFLNGELVASGIVTVSIEPRGSLSGSTVGTAPEMQFSGKYALGCAVPPASLGRSEDSVPVPAPWDGNPRSLTLVQDADLVSRECREMSDALGWR